MKQTLWTGNFIRITAATALGAAGGIAGDFALSLLVFDETNSTLASALVLAVQMLPYFFVPLFAAPWMDRRPRKPVLVAGDLLNAGLYALAGLYLLRCEFTYGGYLAFSALLAALGAFDELAYGSFYPALIPPGLEEKGYAVSAMLYPVLRVVMTPLAALLFDRLGVGPMLLLQAAASLCAAAVESGIRVQEERRTAENIFSLRAWLRDIREAAEYLKRERGLCLIYGYMAVTNGVGSGLSPLLVAFFRTTPGFTAGMYALLSVAEFLGRSLGGLVQYRIRLPARKKYGFAFLVYQFYETMDACLLWLPYPLMLANRACAGFLGINSASMRQAAVQRYLPEGLRARVNGFESMCRMAAGCCLSLVLGAMGEWLDYRFCVSLGAAGCLLVCWLTIGRGRRDVRTVYENPPDPGKP